MIMGRLEEELAALGAMSSAQLRAEWRKIHKEPAPSVSPDLLARGIAYRLQERRHGGLASSSRRQIVQLSREMEKTGTISGVPEVSIKPGTRLSRDWQGKTYHVLVMDDGYFLDDRRYSSLSQIATAITGVQWSGPRFFGLVKRSRSSGQRRTGNG